MVVTELFPELDGFELKREALEVWLSVFEHQEESRVLLDPKKPEKGRKKCLLPIYGRLNRDSIVRRIPKPSYLNGLDYAVSFMLQFCNSERAGSPIYRVKTTKRIKRAGLNQDSFNLLVYGAFNNAPVLKPDTPRLVSKWRANGHLTGTTF